MCGIAGFIDPQFVPFAESARWTVQAMADTLGHRGPDDRGEWLDPAAAIALAHRRLSIVDLSPAGHQPMVSASGRFVVVYNGEIYNAAELRRPLAEQGARFRGHSDTEVLLESCATHGVRATVERLCGMFAFALWDTRQRTLTLVRDRLGIKPLYWGLWGGAFLFASELKAFARHPRWAPEIDRDRVAAFLRFGYVPAPWSIYKQIRKLAPGTLLTVRSGAEPEITRYWDARQLAVAALREPLPLSDQEATDQLETLLSTAIQRRMVADVPLGAFLSGGIDSSTVAALMQARSGRRIRTFSIGFGERGYDESAYAKAVAAHLGTEHTQLYVGAPEALALIPELAKWYDEPFGDSSQIPMILLSQLTRRYVTVALSGDGGDELFGGYTRYALADRIVSVAGRIPRPFRVVGGTGISLVPAGVWDVLERLLPCRLRAGRLAKFMRHAAFGLTGAASNGLYREIMSICPDAETFVPGSQPMPDLFADSTLAVEIPEFFRRAQFLDLVTYLPDDILTKIDRASMAASLEARVPLLDHTVVEFTFRLATSLLRRQGKAKWLLRQVLYRYVPPALVERPKMGFAVPLEAWLRGPLRAWAENLLNERRLRESVFLDPVPVRRLWGLHLAGGSGLQHALWNLLMFQAWHERWMRPAS